MKFLHNPVLPEQVLAGLNIDGGAQLFIDGTCGGGGHSETILKASKNTRLIAVDKDADAIQECQRRLKPYHGRVEFLHSDFKAAAQQLCHSAGKVSGVLLDLGVSSYQLDNFERGFSYRADDAPLDMRMDRRQQKSAYDVINGYTKQALSEIIFRYGEEKFARRIAENIDRVRSQRSIKTCGELREIIYDSIPAAARRTGGNPAKRTFQAVRIEVNDELGGLDKAIEDYTGLLCPNGRLCVITFHSLEDRIVKQAYRRMEMACTCAPGTPVCICGGSATVRLITKKPITANESELAVNPRSAGAKLRVLEKL